MDQSVALISEAKAAVEDPTAPNKQLRLAQAAKAVSQALNQVVNCMPEVIVFDQAIKSIAQSSLALQSGKVRREAEEGVMRRGEEIQEKEEGGRGGRERRMKIKGRRGEGVRSEYRLSLSLPLPVS